VLNFRSYISEIFQKDSGSSDQHGEHHPDLITPPDSNHVLEYSYTPKDAQGNDIKEKSILTRFYHERGNSWNMVFSVGSRTDALNTTHDFPTDITKKVHEHLTHFVNRWRNKKGQDPVLEYKTKHPKKHRIYQMVAKRLGIRAENIA